MVSCLRPGEKFVPDSLNLYTCIQKKTKIAAARLSYAPENLVTSLHVHAIVAALVAAVNSCVCTYRCGTVTETLLLTLKLLKVCSHRITYRKRNATQRINDQIQCEHLHFNVFDYCGAARRSHIRTR